MIPPKVIMTEGEERTPRYLYIDPGETYGYAGFNGIGEVVSFGQFHYNVDVTTINNLITPEIIFVGIEDYRNYSSHQQKKWSRNQTSKNIGKIETVCELKGVPYALLMSGNKTTGYLMLGLQPPSNHSISHQYDAAAHGANHLTIHGIRDPMLNIPEGER